MDIVVLGVGATLARAGSGFTHVQVCWVGGCGALSLQRWLWCTAAAAAACCGMWGDPLPFVRTGLCVCSVALAPLQRKQLSELLEDLLDALLQVRRAPPDHTRPHCTRWAVCRGAHDGGAQLCLGPQSCRLAKQVTAPNLSSWLCSASC